METHKGFNIQMLQFKFILKHFLTETKQFHNSRLSASAPKNNQKIKTERNTYTSYCSTSPGKM